MATSYAQPHPSRCTDRFGVPFPVMGPVTSAGGFKSLPHTILWSKCQCQDARDPNLNHSFSIISLSRGCRPRHLSGGGLNSVVRPPPQDGGRGRGLRHRIRSNWLNKFHAKVQCDKSAEIPRLLSTAIKETGQLARRHLQSEGKMNSAKTPNMWR